MTVLWVVRVILINFWEDQPAKNGSPFTAVALGAIT